MAIHAAAVRRKAVPDNFRPWPLIQRGQTFQRSGFGLFLRHMLQHDRSPTSGFPKDGQVRIEIELQSEYHGRIFLGHFQMVLLVTGVPAMETVPAVGSSRWI